MIPTLQHRYSLRKKVTCDKKTNKSYTSGCKVTSEHFAFICVVCEDKSINFFYISVGHKC